ncbi:MAG: cellulase family glycosylhydrolase [Ruminococcus sp.]|nr:cellulase family glycosylhydrolase [Ruminococcus sp.]
MGLLIVGLIVALILTNLDKDGDSSGDKKAARATTRQSADSGDEEIEDENSESDEDEDSDKDDTNDDSEEEKDDSKAADDSKDDGSQAADDSKDEPQGGADSKDEAKDSNEIVLTYSGNNTWQDGSTIMTGMELGVYNGTGSTVSDWKLELEVESLKNCQGWNGTYTCKGDTLTITPADYNKDIQSKGTINLGANIGTGVALNIKSAKLGGKDIKVVKGNVPKENNQPQQGGNNGGSGGGNNGGGDSNSTPVDVDALLKRSDKAKQGDDWLHTDGSKILDKDGKQVWLTGVNWFGYNTGTNTFDGLWNSELVSSVKGIADHGFNLIRVPMSAELINQWAAGEYPKANYNNAYNPALNDMNSQEIFDYFLKLAEANGIKVMIDIHSAETDASGHNVNLWYTSKVSVDDFYAALEYMADRYKQNDTIIAFDLKNEPHGKPAEGKQAAIWNNSKDANNWKYVAETAASKVLAKNPNVLIMVEGTEIYPKNSKGDYSSTSNDDYYFNWWGGNLRAVKDFPIDLGKYQDKLVYSPHDYGPTVYEQPWFKGSYSYNSLMKDCWRDNWFYIQEQNIAPLLIGEWGGFMTEPNITWMTYMRKLIKDNHVNHTFWCFNANSGDTGGLVLDDFTTWDTEKYNFVKEVLWQQGGKFVGLDHEISLGDNGITLKAAKSLS